MARATGIEIGETAISVAAVDGSPKKYRLTGAARVLIEESDDPAVRRKAEIAALKQAVKQAKAHRDFVTLGVKASRAVIREITLPFTDVEQIKKVIKFEAESHLHEIPIEDVVVAFHKVSETGGKSRILIFAVKKDDLRDALESASAAGLDPLHVTVDAGGLFNFWRSLPDAQGDEAHVLLDVGEKVTVAVICAGDRVRQVRAIRAGTETVTRAVAAELGVEKGEAAREANEYAAKAARPFAVAGDLAPTGGTATAVELKREIVREGHGGLARKLVSEVLRSVTSCLTDRKLASVVLTGVGAGAPGLASEFERAFGAPVRRLDPATEIEHKLKEGAASHVAGATGLALVGIGQDVLGLDFRQEEFRFARKLDRVKTPLLFGLVLIFILAAFLGIGEYLRYNELQLRLDAAGKEARELGRGFLLPLAKTQQFAVIIGQKNADDWERLLSNSKPEDVARALMRESDVAAEFVTKNYGWKPGEKTAAADNLTTSALTRLAEFMKALQKAKDRIGPFTVDKLSIGEFEITFTMTVQESSRWDVVKQEFENLDTKPTATRGADRPQEPGMRRLEGCKLEWPKGGR
jgi:type IV pilus assembly protein PilM